MAYRLLGAKSREMSNIGEGRDGAAYGHPAFMSVVGELRGSYWRTQKQLVFECKSRERFFVIAINPLFQMIKVFLYQHVVIS
jgi:hypothetical protein